MQHKEESRKPGGGALHQGRAGLLFLWGCLAAGSRGPGVPPIKGESGLIDSAAGYEYVRSSTEHKNKIYPSIPPCKDMPKKLTGSLEQK